MDIVNFIIEKALVLIPVLIVLGKVIKDIPDIPNWVIPVVLLVPGVIGGMALAGWTVEGAIQGVLVSGAAVYGNQLYKQIGEGINKDEDI